MDLHIGDLLGDYRLEKLLGRGATGIVYLATQGATGQKVAVKVLHFDEKVCSGAATRFERERALLSEIHHPNVVRILDWAIEGGCSFIVMELLTGPTLRERLTRGPIAGPDLVRFGSQLLGALGAIHKAGILHRDLTPSNLILEGDRLVVLDFGLAKLVGEQTISQFRSLQLSLAYAPPERYQGLKQTAASDIYQAGVVLFEASVGRHPFPETDASKLVTSHLFRTPPRATSLNAALPPFIDEFLAKALKKNPLERYRDAASMEDDWSFLFRAADSHRG